MEAPLPQSIFSPLHKGDDEDKGEVNVSPLFISGFLRYKYFVSHKIPSFSIILCRDSVQCPHFKVHILSNGNWPYKPADLISHYSIQYNDLMIASDTSSIDMPASPHIQRHPRNRAAHNRSNRRFVQNLVGPNRQNGL